ncbi:MAG: FcoT family thioesterase [Planctomycetota bacterium]
MRTPVDQNLVDEILRVYKPHCRYLKSAEVETPSDGSPFPVALVGKFAIEESCYIDDTGHLNAVEVNIAFNQAYYVVTAHAIAHGLVPQLEAWTPEMFRKWYLEGSLIHDLRSTFKTVIDPRSFEGEIAIANALRTKNFVVLKLTHRFWDAQGGLAKGRVTMALGRGKPGEGDDA